MSWMVEKKRKKLMQKPLSLQSWALNVECRPVFDSESRCYPTQTKDKWSVHGLAGSASYIKASFSFTSVVLLPLANSHHYWQRNAGGDSHCLRRNHHPTRIPILPPQPNLLPLHHVHLHRLSTHLRHYLRHYLPGGAVLM